jgi:SAM-dependent methyltransferase
LRSTEWFTTQRAPWRWGWFARLNDHGRRQLKLVAGAVLPVHAQRLIQTRVRGRTYLPPKGKVDFGDLRRLAPISREYGYDRGRPVDRYYIENFLLSEADLIKGRVLEVGENTYTLAFGGAHVAQSDVLHIYESNPTTTFVADLSDAPHLPSNAFDCAIVTQTLHLIYDIKAALATLYRILKPGGVLLATVPGISQISDDEWNDTWYWALTTSSVQRLAEEVFPKSGIEVASHGNVLSAISFLQGLSDDELTRDELDHNDPLYQVVITLRASKPGASFHELMNDRWDYQETEQFAYGGENSYRRGMAFLDGHGVIEDWGCGTAYAKRFLTKSRYVGVDGSPSPYVDRVADLQTYESRTDCIFMRHVLEHNWGWRSVLENAVRSFQRRMVLIIFTPLATDEQKIGDNDGIPDLSLSREEVIGFFRHLVFTEESFESDTEYGREHVFYIEKTS